LHRENIQPLLRFKTTHLNSVIINSRSLQTN
jgi:hypothetical protein